MTGPMIFAFVACAAALVVAYAVATFGPWRPRTRSVAITIALGVYVLALVGIIVAGALGILGHA